MTKLLIIHTGGTISMHADSNGLVSQNKVNPLLEVVAKMGDVTIDQREAFNLPSPAMTPPRMMELSSLVKQDAKDYDGIVITHGTDTLEETAYFLDLTVSVEIPVVITGAMRASDQIGSDAVANIQAAVQVASSELSLGMGVLVVLNNQIHAARFATKSNTTRLDTFQSVNGGMLGEVVDDRVKFYSSVDANENLDFTELVDGCFLIKSYAGIDGTLIRSLREHTKVRGLVIEAFGAGNIPVALMEELAETKTSLNIPIMIVSRSYSGSVAPIYGYPGGGQDLLNHGFLLSQELSGPKALLRLRIALSAGLQGEQLNEFLTN